MAKFSDGADTVAVLDKVAVYARLGAASAAVMLAVRWDATVPAATLRVAALAVGLVLSAVGGAAQQADTSPASAARENGGSEAADDVGSPLSPSNSEAGAVTSLGAGTESPGVEASLERRFNAVKRELLEQREKSIDHWLTVIGLVLTFFAIVIAIAGLWAYRSFRSIEAEAKESAAASRAHEEKARGLLKEITVHREESERHLELIRGVTAEGAQDRPGEATRAAEAVRSDPDASPVDRTIARAVTLQRKGKNQGAIQLWRAIAVISEGQDDDLAARAWFSSAYLHAARDPEEAIADYDKAIASKPDFAGAYNNRGNAKDDLGRHEEAFADYDKALALRPDFAEAYFNRGNAKGGLGRSEEAIADYDKAIASKPDFAEAYSNRGLAKKKLSRPEEAIADYDKAIASKPDFAGAYNNRGNAKRDLGRSEEAIADYDKAIASKPDFAEAYFNRGNAKHDLGRHEEAIADYDKALASKPDYAEACFNRGFVNHGLERHDEAMADFGKAIALKPGLRDDLSGPLSRYLSG